MPNTAANAGSKPIVLAYSGGLDTSFLVPWLAENYGRPIITVTVDTGGIDEATARTLCEKASSMRAARCMIGSTAALRREAGSPETCSGRDSGEGI